MSAIPWTLTGIIVSRVNTMDATRAWNHPPVPSACPLWSKQASIVAVIKVPLETDALPGIITGNWSWAATRNGQRRTFRSVPMSPMPRVNCA